MNDTYNQCEETPVAPPEWDTGVFTVWDNGNQVALLWVTHTGNKLAATEYWGLGPNWVWPSSTNTNKTFQFKYDASYGTPDVTSFKASCDTLFGSGNTTYQKHTTATF